MAIGDRIIVMNHGFIEDSGTPERIYLRPASRFTASFMGESNLFDGTVISSNTVKTASGTFPVEASIDIGAAVTLSIRPEHIHTEAGENRLSLGKAQITEGGFFGTHHQCTATLVASGQTVKVRLPQKTISKSGEMIDLYSDPSDIVLLNA